MAIVGSFLTKKILHTGHTESHDVCGELHQYQNGQKGRNNIYIKKNPFVTCHVSHVTCHVSHVMCCVPGILTILVWSRHELVRKKKKRKN